VRAKVREGNPGGRSETTRVGFMKQVGFNFKPEVKERVGVMDEQSGKTDDV